MTFRMLLAGLITVLSGCTEAAEEPGGGLDTTFAAQMASSWHWVGDPQRIQVGIFGSGDEGVRVVSGGSVELSFTYLADGAGEPVAGPTATATYVPVPGTEAGDGPALTSGRGVYEAEGVVFERAGVWEVEVSAEIDGLGRRLTANLVVTEDSPIPAPGDPAPKTRNLTLDSKGVPDAAIDSMAAGGREIPDPELHRWTVADAIEEGRPTLVLIGTPAYCTSRFCGPEVEELQRLAQEYPERAVYIHIEVWKDYSAQPQVINKAAADWLYRDGDMTEPWLFLVGSDGIVVDRWGSLFDSSEVADVVSALPSDS